MTDPAQAFLNHGNVDQWTRGAGPTTGIGAPMVDGFRRVWPSPDFAPPEYEPARFGTIDEWRPKYAPVYALTAGQIAAQYAAAL